MPTPSQMLPRRFTAYLLVAVWLACQVPPAIAVGPVEYRSRHVVLHTDLPADEARPLLNRLETILKLIGNYWGRPLAGQIECRVVHNLDAWPDDALSPLGRAKIAAGAGITTTRTMRRGGQFVAGQAIVYAVAEGGTPQHEIVHAYCGQTFGSTGPLWYSEGMAELGQAWQPDDTAVRCRPHVIDYLNHHATKTVAQIVADDALDGQTTAAARTGDSWQAYACRWALCHLLVHNENYRDRFRALGLAYLTGAPGRFDQVFAPVSAELEFEYQQFVRHLSAGYRVELCQWDWHARFRAPTAAPLVARIAAQRGWQPSGAKVERGQHYAYTTHGTWRLHASAAPVSAVGHRDGAGGLEAVVLHDYALSEVLPLAAGGTFTAPATGKLYLRCREDLGELADNSGTVTVKIVASTAAPVAPQPAAAARSRSPAR